MSRIAARPDPFDLWLSTPASSDIIEHPTRLLLDIPPREVRVRIAHFVSRGVQNEHVLALARTNATQRSAVMDALNSRFDISLVSHPNLLARWVETFAFDIRELVCDSSSWRHLPSTLDQHPAGLCQASTLRRVSIWDDAAMLEAIRDSPSIREVTVAMNSTAQFLPLLQTLKTLSLVKSLELICINGGFCCLDGFDNLPEGQGTISAWCPNLRVLDMHCDVHTNLRSRHEGGGLDTDARDLLARHLPGLPRLEAITLHDIPTAEALLLINGLREVSLLDECRRAYDNNSLRRIAPCLTALLTSACFSESHRMGLGECIELKELATVLDSGNELALAQVLRKMPQLRQLTLRWTWPPKDLPADMGPGRRKRPTFARPENLVALIVDNVPTVEILHLLDVEISQEDLASMLRGVGGQLIELGVELVGQDENPVQRLVNVLGLVMVHCPKLQRLSFDSSRSRLACGPAKYAGRGTKAEMKTPLLDAERLARLVERHVPMLDVRDVDEVLKAAKTHCRMRRGRCYC